MFQILIGIILSVVAVFLSILIVYIKKSIYDRLCFFNKKSLKYYIDNKFILTYKEEYEHQRGLQIVDDKSFNSLIYYFENQNFYKFMSKDKLFGIPIYVGHPDDNLKDFKLLEKLIIGYVVDLDIDFIDNKFAIVYSIAIKDDCPESIIREIKSNKIGASPRWEMEIVDKHKNTYRPIKLISLGLTHNPNIPVSGKMINK